ncbi:MAG: DUF1569 domain-containing protein [Vicinamibacterales bacterium]
MHPIVIETGALLDAATLDVSADAGARRSVPGKWTIAEIVEHLALAYAGTAKGLTRVVAAGAPMASPVTWRSRAGRLLIVSLGYFPEGRQAPAHVTPSGIGLAEALERAHAGLAAVDAMYDEAAARFGARRPILDHPIIGAFSVDDWRRFHRVHTRHHVKQIRTRLGSGAR